MSIFEAAKEMAGAMVADGRKARVLIHIAKSQAKAGEFDAAKETAGVIEGAY
ncbi:MAG: hypothetical protein IPG76_22490 [Acidobacteria bacterium]|nr:hypothetical protein [Acidobacteriota bacterium]